MTPPDDETLQRLRAEIREKRVDLNETVDELKETVSIKRLEALVISLLQEEIMERTESMAKEVGHAATHAGAKIYDTISRNLFPTAIAGIGAAWILSSVLNRSHSDVEGRFRKAGKKVSEAAETAGHAVDRSREKAEALRERTEAEAHHAVEKTKAVIEENPLYVGGVLFAIGALIGFALPRAGTRHGSDDEGCSG